MEKGEYCLKKVFPSRENYYFFTEELRDLELKGVKKKVWKKLKEARDPQNDPGNNKKLRKRYQIDNVLIKATTRCRPFFPRSGKRRRRGC